MGTTFDEVFSGFLSRITDFNIAKLTPEMLQRELEQKLRGSLAMCLCFKDDYIVKADYETKEFNRELTDLEIEIITNWMIVKWLEPQVLSIESQRLAMPSKDFTLHSQANHLKEMREQKKIAKKEASYWTNRYSMMKRMEKK